MKKQQLQYRFHLSQGDPDLSQRLLAVCMEANGEALGLAVQAAAGGKGAGKKENGRGPSD